MDFTNQTILKEFILLGFYQSKQVSIIFFLALFLIYIFTIFGNSFLIITVIVCPQLHLPMYFFLCNLSFIELFFSMCFLPKGMMDMLSRRGTISITGCMVQMNVGTFLMGTECLLLAVMAYDRYVAICSPLYYHIIMSWKVCRNMTIIMWVGSFFMSVGPSFIKPLVFCTKNKLDHFVCEVLALLELACENVVFYKIAIVIVSLFTLVGPLVFIVVSYILIVISVLGIRSTDGRSKAFSTCASHLAVVCMFYGTSITMYTGQTESFSSDLKYISIIYGIVTPVLNPLIYSLRNNDVKEAFHKILAKKSFVIM